MKTLIVRRNVGAGVGAIHHCVADQQCESRLIQREAHRSACACERAGVNNANVGVRDAGGCGGGGGSSGGRGRGLR